MNMNSDPVQKFFLTGGWEDSAVSALKSNFSKRLELSETSRARKLILGCRLIGT